MLLAWRPFLDPLDLHGYWWAFLFPLSLGIAFTYKAVRVRAALEAAKVAYRYLPPYSPDLNPIEPCWSKFKGWLRAKAARSREALDAELGPALATITTQDAQGWFRLCGYIPAN